MIVPQNYDALIAKLNPAVPRRFLYVIAGVLWMIAGTILCVRGIQWMDSYTLLTEIELEGVSIAVAVAGYLFPFSGIVQKNIDRIKNLPERACLFAFTAFRGYAMIAIMMSFGIFLRSTSIPKLYLTIPYNTMGSILLIGSIRFYRQFAFARKVN